MHELGHVIGFHHVYKSQEQEDQLRKLYYKFDSQVSGTKRHDPKSIMTPKGFVGPYFSENDIIGVQKIYPGENPKPDNIVITLIKGPNRLAQYVSGEFEVYFTGGLGPFTYQWYYRPAIDVDEIGYKETGDPYLAGQWIEVSDSWGGKSKKMKFKYDRDFEIMIEVSCKWNYSSGVKRVSVFNPMDY